MSAVAGTCKTCGESLVQVREGGEPTRTYHPFRVASASPDCSALLPIGCSTYLSSNVPHDQFEVAL